MANILIHPNSGIIEFSTGTAGGGLFNPNFTGGAFASRLNYDNFGGLNFTSYVSNPTGLDRFSVDGANGRLFSVTDSLSGSLFSVNDIAGLPIIEAFDDNTVVMGAFNRNDFIITGNSVGIGALPNTGTQKLFVSGNFAVSGSSVFSIRPNVNSTGVVLSGEAATPQNLATTGSTLDTKINSLSGTLTSTYATITNLATTGSTLNTRINSLSGYINSTSSNIVFTTGNQTIGGVKTFTSNIFAPNLVYSSGDYNYFTTSITLGNIYINLANSPSAITATLPSIASGRNYIIKNLNTGTLTVTGSNFIDGNVNLKLYKNESAHLFGVNNVGFTGWVSLNTNPGIS